MTKNQANLLARDNNNIPETMSLIFKQIKEEAESGFFQTRINVMPKLAYNVKIKLQAMGYTVYDNNIPNIDGLASKNTSLLIKWEN